MNLTELPPDGALTREMIRETGEEYSIKERLTARIHGLGRLKLKKGPPALMKLYEDENNTIRTHFDWTKNGSVIRMRLLRKQLALTLADEEIESITLTKKPDNVNPIPFGPFWVLHKLGTPVSIARRFKIRWHEYTFGPVFVELAIKDQPTLVFEMEGEKWSDCLVTFRMPKVLSKLTIVDERKIRVTG